MSIILDALRKADAERERGSVPTLHAQPVPLASADGPPRRAPAVWVGLAAAAGLVLLGAVAAWYAMAPGAPAEPAMPPQQPSVIAVAPPPPETPPAPRVAAPAKAPAPAAAPRAKVLPETHASAPPPVTAIAELPAEIRRQLPALVVGGATYSQSPANRMLIINGKVFHEKDKLAPDLWLEQIQLKSAVLRFRDYRYEITF